MEKSQVRKLPFGKSQKKVKGGMHQEVKKETNLFNTTSLKNKVKDKVLSRLGMPHNLFFVDVINVYSNKYRVNVWIKETGAYSVVPNHQISDSFFVEVTKGGHVRTKPKIEKKY